MEYRSEQEEIVGFGDGSDGPHRRSVGDILRARPWLVVVLVLVVLAGGVVALAAYRASAPELPSLTARKTQVPVNAEDYPQPSNWQAGTDGRPSGPVEIQGEIEVSVESQSGPVEVFGIDGPGITLPDLPVARTTADTSTVRFDGDTVVDCERVTFPVPPDAYGIAARVVDGTRTTSGTLAPGPVAASWAKDVQAACGSWLARRHLTVSAAAVDADPDRPRAGIAMTVTNGGDDDAYIRTNDSEGDDIVVTTSPRGPVKIPANGTARIEAAVVIDACDNVASIRTVGNGTGVPVPVTSDVIDLFGTVGPAAGLESQAPPWTNGYGPAALVLSPAAGTSVSEGLRDACGGIGGFAALVAPTGTTYDPGTRELAARMLINGPPRLLRDIRLVTADLGSGPDAFSPITKRTARLVPDRTGQVVTTLRYRAPTTWVCDMQGLFLPGFDLIARVPTADGGLRTVRFRQFATMWDDQGVRREICP